MAAGRGALPASHGEKAGLIVKTSGTLPVYPSNQGTENNASDTSQAPRQTMDGGGDESALDAVWTAYYHT